MEWNEKKEILVNAGIDVDTVIGRFMGNEQLAIKFLKKFAQDQTFEDLGTYISAADCNGAFNMVHTLKGVAGNLGMTELYEQAVELTERLRGGNMDGSDRYYEEMSAAYHRIIEALACL